MFSNDPVFETAGSDCHLLQFFKAGDAAPVENAAAYIAAGLRLGEGAVVVASDLHTPTILAALERSGLAAERLQSEGKLALFDADTTLMRFLINGHPDAERFERVVGDAMRRMVGNPANAGVRAYGEMVGLLWKRRQYPAAIRLEQLWNGLRRRTPFGLFCWYPVDIFGDDFQTGVVDALLSAHSHLLPHDVRGELERAISQALEEALGPEGARRVAEARAKDERRSRWGDVPPAESMILWLRRNLPEEAPRVLSLAREYYAAALV